MPASTLVIRSASTDDLDAITSIYAWHVENGTGTFELEPPGPSEMARRFEDVATKGLPWLVAVRGGLVVGYAYANHFRPRLAYRFCLEDSIYLRNDASGRGVGRALLAELLSRSEALGARQMLAVIGDSGNDASIGVHTALGFKHAGKLDSAGWKFDRWLDVVIMQKSLGLGQETPPQDARA
jgi:phosphinothricin acetyltransferase